MDKPEGNDGEIDHVATGPPVFVVTWSVIAAFNVNTTLEVIEREGDFNYSDGE